MHKFSILILFSFLFISAGANAQLFKKHRKKNNDQDQVFDRGATYSDYNTSKKSKSKKRIKYGNLDYEKKIKEYEELMEANAKKYKKMEKEMKKPQYSDPTYFGHKHPPKKRKPGKKKFCKECGMVH